MLCQIKQSFNDVLSGNVPIKSSHPRIDTLTEKEFSEKFLDGTLPSFDVMVSLASLEHKGLGQFGEQLNPWGDLITMAKAWCVVKPGGLALVGVPTGPDTILVSKTNDSYFTNHK